MKELKKILFVSALIISLAVLSIFIGSFFMLKDFSLDIQKKIQAVDTMSEYKTKIAQNPVPETDSYAENNVICSVVNGYSKDKIAQLFAAKDLNAYDIECLSFNMNDSIIPYSVKYQGDTDPYQLSKELCFADDQLMIEPNYKLHLSEVRTEVNDPHASLQGWIDAVNLREAWSYATTDQKGTVVVIDTGIYVGHEDLAPNYEAVKDYAYNASNDTYGIQSVADVHYHGTHCCGLAAAATNNSVGVAGASYNANVLPISIADVNMNMYVTWSIKAMNYVTAKKAEVGAPEAIKNIRAMSMSYGSRGYIGSEQNAINNAVAQNILCIAASGNEASSIDYPAAFDNVIAVGSVDNAGVHSDFSNFGEELDVCAPGQRDLSTFPRNWSYNPSAGYNYLTGTSMSTPIVAGLATLVASINPSLTAAEVESVLKETATKKDFVDWHEYYGYGTVNACAAVKKAMGHKLTVDLDQGELLRLPTGWVKKDNKYEKVFEIGHDLDSALEELVVAGITKECCNFVGWNKSGGIISEDIEVKALWESYGVNLTLSLDGGSISSVPDKWKQVGNTDSYTRIVPKDSNIADALADWNKVSFSKKHCTFDGFDKPDITVEADTFVKVKWKYVTKLLTVNLDEGHTTDVPLGWELVDGKYQKYFNEGSLISEDLAEWDTSTIKKEGCVFGSWIYYTEYLLNDLIVNVSWSTQKCLVKVNLNGGSVSSTPQGWTYNNGFYIRYFDYGTNIANITYEWSIRDLQRNSYRLSGWSTSSGFLTEETNIYAYWMISINYPVNIVSSMNPNMVLGVDGAKLNDGANVSLYQKTDKFEQAWFIEPVGNGNFIIKNKHSGKVLDVVGDKAESGTNVDQYEYDGSLGQKWNFVDLGNGDFKITSALYNRLVLDIKDGNIKSGTNIDIADDQGAFYQKFKLVKANEKPGELIPPGFYYIVSYAYPNEVFTIAGASKADGANLELNLKNASMSQVWYISYDKWGYAVIKNMNSSLDLWVEDGSFEPGANVCQDQPTGEMATKWKFVKCGAGYNIVSCLDDNLNIDIAGSSSRTGQNLYINSFKGTSSQIFGFEPVK